MAYTDCAIDQAHAVDCHSGRGQSFTPRSRNSFSVAASSVHVAIAWAAWRTSSIRRKCRRDAQVGVVRIAAVRKGAARRHHRHAAIFGQHGDPLRAAFHHIERNEVTAARLGPAGRAGAAELGAKHVLHGLEFRRDEPALALHVPVDGGGSAEHPRMAQLIHALSGPMVREASRFRYHAMLVGEAANSPSPAWA